MPNNVFAGVPIAVIAIQTASFSSIGLNSSNITVIHRIGNPPQSWIPTRGINPISGFVDGDGYIIYATQNLDLTAYVVPPLPSELEEIENWVIANFALINHTHPVTDITAAGGTEGQVIKIVSGVPTWASGGDQLLNSVTKSALDDLIDDDDLVAGRFYNITDRNIILQAVSTNSFAKVGTRKMLCPANYKIETDTYGNVWKGVWHPALTVATNSLVIYGGSIWKNITGSVGNNNDGDVTSLDATNWGLLSKTSFTNHQYVEKVFGVYYDVENDWVEKQWDNAGNEFGLDYATSQALGYTYNLCDISDWNYGSSDLLFSGNRCFGIFNNVLTGNITDNTNKGIISGNKTVDILKNSNAGDIVYNTVISGIKKNSNTGSLTNASGNIGYNLGQYEISYNNNNGTIELNEVSDPTVSFIINNSNNGNIVSNTNTGNISYNANAGSITGNSNIGVIDGNHCGQDIYNNSNNGDIQYNFNIYGIGENSNNGRIYGNSNLGTINDNTNDGEIYYNNNEDEITDNSNEGDIEFNSNNGKIINNSNKGDIEYNIVLGDIIDCSSGTDDCNIENNISDSSITGVFSDNVSKNTFTRNIDFDSHTVGIGNFAVGPYLVFNTSDVLDVFASTLNLKRSHWTNNRSIYTKYK